MIAEAVAAGRVRVEAARYDLDTGRVELLAPRGEQPSASTAGH